MANTINRNNALPQPAPVDEKPTVDERPPSVSPEASELHVPVAPAPAAAPADVPTDVFKSSKPSSNNPFAMGKIKDGLWKMVVDETSKEHKLKGTLNFGAFSGTAMVSEEVALTGSNAYKNLVLPDRRRNEFAQAHPDERWVKMRAMVGAQANVPVLGVALGFNSTVEVSSISAQKAPLIDAAVDAAVSLVVPLRADAFKQLNAPAGTEWIFRGEAGVTIGRSVLNADLNTLGTAGVGIGAGYQQLWTKNVKSLGDNKVFFMLGRHEIPSVGVSAGVALHPINLPDSNNPLVTRVTDTIEKKTELTAQAGASVSFPHRRIGGVVLDLNKETDRAHYDYLMRSMPLDGEAYLKANNLGANYVGDGRAINTALKLKFGSTTLLSSSTMRTNEHGELVKDGVNSQLGEAAYNRIIEGTLPRFMKGEERNVSVRAGALTQNGVSTHAMAVRLSVTDPAITSEELAQHTRFAKAMELDASTLPDAQSARGFGKGDYAVEVAATEAQLAGLGDRSADDIRLAFAVAQRDIEGGSELPPWFSQQEAFAAFKRRLATAVKPHSDVTSTVLRDYREKFGGRDLRRDIASANAVDHVLEQGLKAKGKPVHEWGRVLEAVGMQSSNDVRAGLLALRRLTGAQVTELSISVAGVRASTSSGVPNKTLLDLVGDIMLPE